MTLTSIRPGSAHPVYEPTPSIPLLITELTHEEFWARYAKARGDAEHFEPGYIAAREKAALLLRAVIADLFALADPGNTHAAGDAAAAANRVRRKSQLMQLPAHAVRAWLREEYETWRNDVPHPPNCPGHCRGTGIVLQTVTWQDDGAAVWAEPGDCLRGEDEDPHFSDCLCRGTGRRWNTESREYDLCDGYTPDPDYARVEPRPGDTWSTGGPYDEEPF